MWFTVWYFFVPALFSPTKDEECSQTADMHVCESLTKFFHQHALDLRWWIANEAHSAELGITMSYPTSANGMIVLLNFFKLQMSGYYKWNLLNFILNITKQPAIDVTSRKPRKNHMTCAICEKSWMEKSEREANHTTKRKISLIKKEHWSNVWVQMFFRN